MQTDIRDYGEGFPVEIVEDKETGRLLVKAINQGGYDFTYTDLIDTLSWVKKNRSELWEEA